MPWVCRDRPAALQGSLKLMSAQRGLASAPWDLVEGKCRLKQVQCMAPGISVVVRK